MEMETHDVEWNRRVARLSSYICRGVGHVVADCDVRNMAIKLPAAALQNVPAAQREM